MELDGMISELSRIVFKISATLLFLGAVVLLWLRPRGTGLGVMLAVIGINAMTAILSGVAVRLTGKKERGVPARTSIIDVLEQRNEQEGINDK